MAIATAIAAATAVAGEDAGDGGAAVHEAGVRVSELGRMPDGAVVRLFTLTGSNGLEAQVMELGATLVSVKVPDRDGRAENVTLRLDTLEEYLRGHPLFGSVVGRYANRIAGARFTLDGVEHAVTPNAGKNHIHGGNLGFHRIVWEGSILGAEDGVGVTFRHASPDGHEGFPGKLEVRVTYRVTAEDELRLEYEAATDRPTHVNLTNHAYWNLAGAGSGDVLGHLLTLDAAWYLPADGAKIPTGEIRAVAGTPMDFTAPAAIGSRIESVEDRNYDHCYVATKREPGQLSRIAKVVEPKGGRTMEVWTTEPGVQLYTARGLGRVGSKQFGPWHGFCLETQRFPDSPNRAHFPSTVLRPGETYRQVTIYRFSVSP